MHLLMPRNVWSLRSLMVLLWRLKIIYIHICVRVCMLVLLCFVIKTILFCSLVHLVISTMELFKRTEHGQSFLQQPSYVDVQSCSSKWSFWFPYAVSVNYYSIKPIIELSDLDILVSLFEHNCLWLLSLSSLGNDSTSSEPMLLFPKRTYQPSNIRRKRTHGFLARYLSLSLCNCLFSACVKFNSHAVKIFCL